jgi:hypothetical protein
LKVIQAPRSFLRQLHPKLVEQKRIDVGLLVHAAACAALKMMKPLRRGTMRRRDF